MNLYLYIKIYKRNWWIKHIISSNSVQISSLSAAIQSTPILWNNAHIFNRPRNECDTTASSMSAALSALYPESSAVAFLSQSQTHRQLAIDATCVSGKASTTTHAAKHSHRMENYPVRWIRLFSVHLIIMASTVLCRSFWRSHTNRLPKQIGILSSLSFVRNFFFFLFRKIEGWQPTMTMMM